MPRRKLQRAKPIGEEMGEGITGFNRGKAVTGVFSDMVGGVIRETVRHPIRMLISSKSETQNKGPQQERAAPKKKRWRIF
jgi:hypothetical protein